MVSGWARWKQTNMSVLEREILYTVVEELLLKSNTELLDGKKRLNWVISDSFSSSFHLKPPIYTSRIHILQKKSTQIPHHGLWEGSNILDRAREGCHRLLSWQIQRSQWAIQVGWVGQFTRDNASSMLGYPKQCRMSFMIFMDCCKANFVLILSQQGKGHQHVSVRKTFEPQLLRFLVQQNTALFSTFLRSFVRPSVRHRRDI